MSLKREDVLCDVFYQSATDSATLNRLVTITIQFRNSAGESLSTTQLTRNIVKASGAKQYAIGLQQVSIGSDPLLVAIESYYRKDTDTLTENLIAGALDFISGNLDQSTTLITSYGLGVGTGLAIADVLPATVLAADGQTTSTITAGASSSTVAAS